MATYLVGIDPGTSCGWAIIDMKGKRIGSGVWDLSSGRHEGAGMRYVRFRSYLGRLISPLAHSDDKFLVAYEEVARHRGVAAAHVYGGIIAVLQELCETHEVPYTGIPVGTIKRNATGKGNASKDMMVAAASRRWVRSEMRIMTHDEADALWIAQSLKKTMEA